MSIPRKSLGKTTEYSVTDLHFICTMKKFIGTGHVVQKLPVDRNVRKSSNGMTGIFAKLCFKKKSRADIVKLVATGDLVPAQLVQIKSAIEKGLTEMQLIELINNNISAEKMKEIIEIAVLENSMAD